MVKSTEATQFEIGDILQSTTNPEAALVMVAEVFTGQIGTIFLEGSAAGMRAVFNDSDWKVVSKGVAVMGATSMGKERVEAIQKAAFQQFTFHDTKAERIDEIKKLFKKSLRAQKESRRVTPEESFYRGKTKRR